MACTIDMLQSLDFAVNKNRFPVWDSDEDYAFTGAMRASGFTSDAGVGLVFETVEYSVREGVIQSVPHCIATFPITTWIHYGNGAYVPNGNLAHPETGEILLQFGMFHVVCRGHTFDVPLEKADLISGEYLESTSGSPTVLALLFKLCDIIPRDWLFSEPGYIKQVIGMPPDAERLFVIEEWEHPSIAIYQSNVKPSTFPDLVAMVEALCTRNSFPKLGRSPNTSWRLQFPKYQAGKQTEE